VSRDEEVLRLHAELREYDQVEIAEVGARVRPACWTAHPEDAEAHALAVVVDVLRFRHRGRHVPDRAHGRGLDGRRERVPVR
jgi:hypothetical protein